MTADEFRNACERLEIRYTDVARIIGATDRAVNRWAAGTRDVPHGIALLLRVLKHVKGRTRYSALARHLRDEADHFATLAAQLGDYPAGDDYA